MKYDEALNKRDPAVAEPDSDALPTISFGVTSPISAGVGAVSAATSQFQIFRPVLPLP
jgi:hypothetical protein